MYSVLLEALGAFAARLDDFLCLEHGWVCATGCTISLALENCAFFVDNWLLLR